MPKFVNKNKHRISVEFSADKPGQLRTFRAGQVITADGFLADKLKETPGVEQASSDDERSWDRHLAQERNPDPSGAPSRDQVERELLTQADLAQHAVVVAGTRRVVGDDQAPFGPPTGTITTKSAVGDRAHFGPNEAHPGDELPDVDAADATTTGARVPTGAEVHNAQVEAATRAERAAQHIIDATSGRRDDDADEAAESDEHDDESEGDAPEGDAKPSGSKKSSRRGK